MDIVNIIMMVGGILAALLTIFTFIGKLVNPVKEMLEKYDKALTSANYKLEATEKFIQQFNKETSEHKLMLAAQKRSIQNMLRYILFSQTLQAKQLGYRDNSITKDLEMIYQCYTEEGLNGLGAKQYHEYLELPDYEEWSKKK